ncbi:ESCRT-I complex subunit tsg101 isoform X1 [Macrosteles quadrilineatus]|uniref:ESCRT-I complex subunit tsg101 isoform X1 n=1 Tax=Macrosteles quadrilineatus TaxID=74068 RepID=UPI0023E1A374|nr:ESCRT-I complex subunit tsg101 isoform X1 [Macrosteles quadrilineatus]
MLQNTMELVQSTFLVFAALLVVINPQKVPPGVNPTTYQQPPPPPPQQQQQYQPPPPPPPSYQQQPIQSAVPLEHHQERHHHDHHSSHGQPQLLNTANLAEEREHMQEHLNVNIDTSKMSEQELQFHYFKMHDADNNNKLDGCELIKSLIHWHEEHSPEEPFSNNDEEIMELIDQIMTEADLNFDGYIDWIEFNNLNSNSTKDYDLENDENISEEITEGSGDKMFHGDNTNHIVENAVEESEGKVENHEGKENIDVQLV